MLRVVLHMKVKPGRGEEFITVWREIGLEIARNPACVRQVIGRGLRDPDSFVVTSDWSDHEAFHRFEVSEEQDLLTAPLRELRETATMTVNEVLFEIEGDDDAPLHE
jgi:quinol monooxygenase YgiN